MTLNEAFRKAIKTYFADKKPIGSETSKTLETDLKYTKKYFDMIAEEFGLEDSKAVKKELEAVETKRKK